jgi:hypothetical protein
VTIEVLLAQSVAATIEALRENDMVATRASAAAMHDAYRAATQAGVKITAEQSRTLVALLAKADKFTFTQRLSS